MRAFSDDRLLLSVFHDERVDFGVPDSDPWALIAERNWRTWLYDPDRATATPVDSLDWNSGATYVFAIDGAHQVLVPSTDYAATRVVTRHDDLTTTPAFDLRGWGTRLFRLR